MAKNGVAVRPQALRERKVLVEVKEFLSDRVVVGWPSVMGNVDDGGDVIQVGAYVKTLKERLNRVRWLWMHDSSQPPTATILDAAEVARADLPAAVLAMYPEATGALQVKREYLETPRGEEILTGIRKGAITEGSIGYDAVEVEYPEELEIAGKRVYRMLRQIRLWDGSDVNWGMNAAAAAGKSLDGLIIRWLREGDAALTEADRQALAEAAKAEEIDLEARARGLAEGLKGLRAGQREGVEMRRRRLEIMRGSLALLG